MTYALALAALISVLGLIPIIRKSANHHWGFDTLIYAPPGIMWFLATWGVFLIWSTAK